MNWIQKEERGATLLQATYRGKVDRRKFRPMVIAAKVRLQTAVWLQGMYRLKVAEDALKAYQVNAAHDAAAATTIIALARGVLARTKLEAWKVLVYRSASRINAGARGRFDRKRASARWKRVDDAWKWLQPSQPRTTFQPMLPKDAYSLGLPPPKAAKAVGHAAARGIFWDDLSAFATFDFAGTGKVNRIEFSKAVKVG